MTAEPIDEIEVWSKKLAPWRQDALRRLAVSDALSGKDIDELLAMIKQAADFELTFLLSACFPAVAALPAGFFSPSLAFALPPVCAAAASFSALMRSATFVALQAGSKH